LAVEATPKKRKWKKHYTSGVKLLGSLSLDTSVYALRYSRDGSRVIAAGEDGKVRFISATDAKALGEFTPVPLSPSVPQTATALK
jgi:hypothetical protein